MGYVLSLGLLRNPISATTGRKAKGQGQVSEKMMSKRSVSLEFGIFTLTSVDVCVFVLKRHASFCIRVISVDAKL